MRAGKAGLLAPMSIERRKSVELMMAKHEEQKKSQDQLLHKIFDEQKKNGETVTGPAVVAQPAPQPPPPQPSVPPMIVEIPVQVYDYPSCCLCFLFSVVTDQSREAMKDSKNHHVKKLLNF